MLRFGDEYGNRPTFGADSFAVESHLQFPSARSTADTEVEIFLDRLRDEIKFPSVEALKEQISVMSESQKYFRRLKTKPTLTINHYRPIPRMALAPFSFCVR
jgi:hypothetical protein